MSADLLREAAAKMRERAEAADTHGRWVLAGPDDDYAPPWTVMSSHEPGNRTWVCERARHSGEYIASWHPAVALAVADWLDAVEAESMTEAGSSREVYEAAVAVARTYLGSDQ